MTGTTPQEDDLLDPSKSRFQKIKEALASNNGYLILQHTPFIEQMNPAKSDVLALAALLTKHIVLYSSSDETKEEGMLFFLTHCQKTVDVIQESIDESEEPEMPPSALLLALNELVDLVTPLPTYCQLRANSLCFVIDTARKLASFFDGEEKGQENPSGRLRLLNKAQEQLDTPGFTSSEIHDLLNTYALPSRPETVQQPTSREAARALDKK